MSWSRPALSLHLTCDLEGYESTHAMPEQCERFPRPLALESRANRFHDRANAEVRLLAKTIPASRKVYCAGLDSRLKKFRPVTKNGRGATCVGETEEPE